MTEKNNIDINKVQQSKKRITIIAISSIIILSGVVYLYLQNRSEMQEIVQGMEKEKDILTSEFLSLSTDYDSLKTNSDTLNLMLSKEQERIAQLLEEIQMVKATNSAKIREFKKELNSLRKVMKNYVIQIDSLNQRNQALVEENTTYRRRVTKMHTKYQELEDEKETLVKKVNIASKLEAFNFDAIGLNSKGKENKRASKVVKIRICFTLQKNITAPVGNKTIYLRLLRPDGNLLYHSKDDLFEYEKQEINYSSKRVVEYGGEELDVCVYYQADEGELLKGEYVGDVFADGKNIGTTAVVLK